MKLPVREHNLRTLYEVARKINSVLDLEQLLNNIMDSALDAMNGERGMIFLIENEQLALKVSRNVERETIKDATEKLAAASQSMGAKLYEQAAAAARFPNS